MVCEGWYNSTCADFQFGQSYFYAIKERNIGHKMNTFKSWQYFFDITKYANAPE